MLLGGGDQLLDFGTGQHIGERFLFGNPQLGQHLVVKKRETQPVRISSHLNGFQQKHLEPAQRSRTIQTAAQRLT